MKGGTGVNLSPRSPGQTTFKKPSFITVNPLLDKISKESKSVFLYGDFNVNLLKYDHHVTTNEFLGSLSSHMFLSHIIHPNRVTCNSKTLTDDIFSNILSPDSVSGSLTAAVSDHLP